MNKGVFFAIQAALLYQDAAAQISSGEMMHHLVSNQEQVMNPAVLVEHEHVSHGVHPVAGYYELEDFMDGHPEFPLEMYIPLYYDSFKTHHGWEYADLLQQCMHEGHTHDRAHEVYWPAHMNEMDENFSLSSFGSSLSKFGQQAGSQMSKWGQQAGSQMSKWGQQAWQ